ncbi:MAG: 50S ribosomal protein L32e [Candidatus Bathyarchaeia archaeon]
MKEGKKKPRFIRQESWRYIRVKDSWRKPKGKTSRMRRKIKGWPKMVSAGYGNARAKRGLHPSGLREALVHSPHDLYGLDPGREAVRIASTVGEKKRLEIMSKAAELNLKVLNPLRLEEPTAPGGEEAAEEASGEVKSE